MGDLMKEIDELLGEAERSGSGESYDSESEGNVESAEAASDREDRGTDQETGERQETETAERSQTEQSEGDSTEGDASEGESSTEAGVKASEAESSEEGEEDEDPKDAQIRKLQEEINRLSKGETAASQEADSSSESQAASAEEFDPTLGYDYEEILESKETFSKWAKDFYEQAKSKAKEEILQDLPNTVGSYVQQQVEVKEAAKEFYRQNPELEGHKQYVSRVANEVASEHPDWSFPQICDEAAKRARETLGLKQQAKTSERQADGQKKSPAFAKGTGKASSAKKQPKSEAEQLSEMEREIQDLIQ